ncbi:hypothetical protein H1R20_g9114, partial [Candolleomyces eurysporus]
MGFSFFASLFHGPIAQGSLGYAFDSIRLLIMGSLLEAGRRFFLWLIERFRLQYSITAQFTEGDPTFEWLVMFMTEHKIWRRSRDFRISAKSSMRRWGIRLGAGIAEKDEHVDLVPTYELPHLFRWHGIWIETKRSTSVVTQPPFGGFSPSVINLTMYTLNIKALQEFIEEARLCYLERAKASVILHTATQPNFGPGFVWNSVKRKLRRPISSIVLETGMMESIVDDAREFIEMENWYIDAGIPHRRGYLLYGPPGTGKTSTIHALAGELGMEIFSLSLSAGFVDDAFLQQAASSIPKKAIFLIEDIDCAFGSRDEGDNISGGTGLGSGYMSPPGMGQGSRRSSVTLSGLLNVIDGIGSEEGVLFFATTNHVDHLDSALLRPGRIDRKVHYKLTGKAQAAALFSRFFPAEHVTLLCEAEKGKLAAAEKASRLATLANEFAETIPDYEFSTAELQGFLLSCKRKPEEAVLKAKLWVTQELLERQQKPIRFINGRQQRTPPDTQPGVEASPANGVGFSGMGGITPTASTSASDHIAPPTPPQTPSITPKEPKEGSIVDALLSGPV